jgi:DUF1707 SHOCT-like domain
MQTGRGAGTPSAAGGGHLRASHADRERAVGLLKIAFVQGRLTKDELDARVGRAFGSRTYADLAAVTADIPAGMAGARPPVPARSPAEPPVQKNISAGVRASTAAAASAALLWAAFILTGNIVVFLVAAGAMATAFVALFLTGTQMLGSWIDKRSRGQAPPPAAAAGQRPQAVARLGSRSWPSRSRSSSTALIRLS